MSALRTWSVPAILLAWGMAHGHGLAAEPAGAAPSFSRDIRPLFNKHCSACHGGVKHSGGVSFVYRHRVLEPAESGAVPVVPGKPDDSELIRRVLSNDEDEVMPPKKHGPRLKEEDVAKLRAWIAQGAPWDEHWAFVPPKPQTLPLVNEARCCLQGIDCFVRARLEKEGLKPSAPADRAQWLRRVTFDLTGLPPTIEEIRAFLNDAGRNAYEKVVDRLLNSARYGERWATVWLDLSRYADSQGYEADKARVIWPYRDWLVRALNADMPFDQFVIRQIAGDLLPGATLDDHIATAFHRNTPTNSEGGTDDEEFRIAAVLDRVATTWRAFQGVTFNCVQCHSHPYDPFEHPEFYQFAAFFNTQKDWDMPEDEPKLRVPLQASEFDRARRMDEQLAKLRAGGVAETSRLAAEDSWTSLAPQHAQSTGQTQLVIRKAADGIADVVAQGTVSHYSVFTIDVPVPETVREMTALKLDALPLDPDKAKHSAELGFVISLLRAIVVTPDNEAGVIAATTPPPDNEVDVAVNSSAKKKVRSPPAPESVKNPPPQPGEISFAAALGDEVDPVFDPQTTLNADKAGWGANPRMTHARRLVLVPDKPVDLPAGSKLRLIIRHDEGGFGYAPLVMNRSRFAISNSVCWTDLARGTAFSDRRAEIARLEKERAAIGAALMPVMAEQDPSLRRQTNVFVRGNWMDKGDPVTGAIPGVFGSLPKDQPADRLALARWLVSPQNPLTARVAVNRFWEQLFGLGIVETLEDFGSSGQPPSHPEMLDYLALRFQNELGWSMKNLLREMVLSATYRQDATATAELRSRDPGNRLLARGPRNRLTAEMVRDNALAVSGLLSEKMFGPPVMPAQPEGIWRAARSGLKWQPSKGEDGHRRALYTYWRRSSPYPSSLTFDAPDRLFCTARRTATNTPLQALVTLNDPVFIECAVALAGRMAKACPDGIERQVAHGCELATGSVPSAADLKDLVALHSLAIAEYTREPSLCKVLGGSPEKAALALVANAILNLDTVLVR